MTGRNFTLCISNSVPRPRVHWNTDGHRGSDWLIEPERYRAIGGISLGGSLALTLTLEHPDLFGAMGGHSPAVDSTLAGRLAPLPMWSTLRVVLDVGRNDSVSPGVQAFAAALEAHDLKPAFHLYSGGHDRPNWRAHTAEYLAFYAAGW